MPVTNKCDAFARMAPDVVKGARKIARNTWRYVVDGNAVVRLHRTDIVTGLGKGRYALDSGGYRSMVTKDRMNGEVPGFSIYSLDGLWYVRRQGDGATVPYYDGIILPDAFKGRGLAKAKAALAEQERDRKLILAYVRKVRTMKEIPQPGPGDCWLCMAEREPEMMESGRRGVMGHARDNGQSGKTDNLSHFRDHLKEKYVHGTLLWNALRWSGYTDRQVGYFLSGSMSDRQLLCSSVRRYLRRKMGIG